MKKSSKPRAPDHLSTEAKRWWSRLTEEYELSDQGGKLLLQTVCECFDRMRQAQEAIERDGATIRDRFGVAKQHPLLCVERDSRAQMLMALRHLGLDIEPTRSGPGRPGGVA